ncbi:hypothetical protein ARMGADRAFT_1033541 [Armillaria gallica]|uniref:Uncharacterized protein n=1 Tax=Armillaria gallica TaxID=47427 RepID=A0A2H3D0V6_ARMGA|nr:hypothetical protein ARMGADRAFT_1033541 [Armillaria gallica]
MTSQAMRIKDSLCHLKKAQILNVNNHLKISYAQLIKLIKQYKKFLRESIQDLENFANTPMIEECLAIVLAVTLETCDTLVRLQEEKATESWELKDSFKQRLLLVKGLLHQLWFIFMLFYTAFPSLIPLQPQQALWANNAKNLSAKKDAAGGNVLLSFILEELSSIHSTIKTKVHIIVEM